MSIPLQKDSKSQSKKQSHSNELSKNSRKEDVRWGERPEKEGRLIELVGDQNTGSEAPPRSKIGRERKEHRRCQGRSTARGAMKKSRYVKVIEWEEVTQSNESTVLHLTRLLISK